MSLRLAVGAALTVCLVGRPVQLSSSRWWHIPALVQSLALTGAQRDAIDRIDARQLERRRRCVERFTLASRHVSQLLRDGVYDDVLRETEAEAAAAAEERMWTRARNEEIRALLTTTQRARLSRVAPGVMED